jgi:hypothetical protein
MDGSSKGEGVATGGRVKKRTRRGQDNHAVSIGAPSSPSLVALSVVPVVQGRPVKIGRTRRTIQVEDNLRHALLILVLGQEGLCCAAEVRDALALRFGLQSDVLDLRRAAPSIFIACLPNEDLDRRIFNGGQPFFAPPLRMHIRRWSHQALACGGGALPLLLDIELRGIPGHIWATKTTEFLLSDYCLIQGVHPDSRDGVDLFTFRLRVWCLDPTNIPAWISMLKSQQQLKTMIGCALGRLSIPSQLLLVAMGSLRMMVTRRNHPNVARMETMIKTIVDSAFDGRILFPRILGPRCTRAWGHTWTLALSMEEWLMPRLSRMLHLSRGRNRLPPLGPHLFLNGNISIPAILDIPSPARPTTIALNLIEGPVMGHVPSILDPMPVDDEVSVPRRLDA